jgi:hypothetical protein
MESAADTWAVEMLIITALSPDSSLFDRAQFDHAASPLQRTHLVIAAVEFALLVLGATDSANAGRWAMLEDLGDTLSGKIRGMYPGFGSRAAFAVPSAIKRVQRDYPHIKWIRWWRMRKDLSTFDTKAWGSILLQAWTAAELGGLFPALGRGDVKPLMLKIDQSSIMRSKMATRDDSGIVDLTMRFDYLASHRTLAKDLEQAKAWWAAEPSTPRS